jgi:guanine deaminase
LAWPEAPPRGLEHPPFALRAHVLSPLGEGRFLDEPDGLVVVEVDGTISWSGAATQRAGGVPDDAIDFRPLLLLPGLVDLHAHLPQLPISGVGFAIGVMDWLGSLMAPLERAFGAAESQRLSPRYFRQFAAAGTTTACLYSSADAGATEAAFDAVEGHGLRVIMGQPLMDLGLRYDTEIPDDKVTDVRLEEAAAACAKWHGRDGGRIMYAFTPRGALGCSARIMAAMATLAHDAGAYWQTHLSEDRDEAAAVLAVHPDADDPLALYERAGGLGPRTILAHCVHINDREVAAIRDSATIVAHCPSNLWLGGGMMRLARYREEGLNVGLASDVGGSLGLSMWDAMQLGAITQNARAIALGDAEGDVRGRLRPLEWLELASLQGARCLGLDHTIGSLEPSKHADMILVDAEMTSPVPGEPLARLDDAEQLLGRLIFRPHPDMVRASWVRGRRLAGPGGWESDGVFATESHAPPI